MELRQGGDASRSASDAELDDKPRLLGSDVEILVGLVEFDWLFVDELGLEAAGEDGEPGDAAA